MKLQQSKPVSELYGREEDFSLDLSNNMAALGIGSFEDAETESKVGTRKADLVAKGDDGTLVIENQFGRADWDHWGRLEAYARLKEADVAALVAEDFEELMVVTCNLRNEDSKTDWYLIRVNASLHDELSFLHVARPAIDVQTEKKISDWYRVLNGGWPVSNQASIMSPNPPRNPSSRNTRPSCVETRQAVFFNLRPATSAMA